jgi:hypothetical protein
MTRLSGGLSAASYETGNRIVHRRPARPPGSGRRNPGERGGQIMLKRDLLAAMAAALLIGLGTTPAPALINDNLFTTYQVNSNDTTISWVTCGATQQASGCFDSGQLSGFGKVCAVMEVAPKIVGNTVTQGVGVLDGSFQGGSSVVLDVYRKIDVITASFDTTTFTLVSRLALPLTGGASVSCFMAANAGFVFVGTSKSTSAVKINKTNFSLSTVGGFSPPIPVNSIIADDRGYVSVSFGSGNNSGFVLFGPDGGSVEDGGGGPVILLNEQNAYKP